MNADDCIIPCPYCYEINEVNWRLQPEKKKNQRLVKCFDCEKTFILHVESSRNSHNFRATKENE